MIEIKPTDLDAIQIVTQASSLTERLENGAFEINPIQEGKQQILEKRLAQWCQIVADGNWEKFQKRLQWDNLDFEQVRQLMGSVSLADKRALPSWAKTLVKIIQISKSFTFNLNLNLTDPKNPLPFEDVLLPIILVARQKLLKDLGAATLSAKYLPLKLISETAYLTLEHNLLQRLVNLCSKTLEFEFSHFRPLGHSLFNLLVKESKSSKSKQYYNAFVQKLLQDGLLAFFQKYSVLSRLIATTVDFWVEATAEFLQRLEADLSEIQRVYNHSETTVISKDRLNFKLGKVIEIEPSLSDLHNRGRSVIAIKFESGLKLIYKPKNLGLEVVYNQFLDWCNQHDGPLHLKVLKVSNRQTYGWVEYVEHLPCKDSAAAQRFYQRAGMLLCLLYVFRGTDCYSENLIASSEHLVLIDLETLMHPEAKSFSDFPEATEAMEVANQQLFDSVLRTGLLPRWEFNKDCGIAYDISGLGSSIEPQLVSTRVQRWKDVNTDDMHLGVEEVTVPISTNIPILNGVSLSSNDYLKQIVGGFEQMYCFLSKQREALLAPDSPLAKLQAQQVRFVFRATKVYETVLQKSLSPEFLRSGVDRSIEIDILSRAFLIAPDKPYAWPLCWAERQAMEQLDIPYFLVDSDSNTFTIGVEQPIKGYFKQASYQQILTQLRSLDEIDLAQQVAIIREAFYAKMASKSSAKQVSAFDESSSLSTDFSNISFLTNEQLLEQAHSIARNIRERAIMGADGSVNWISLNYIPKTECYQLQPLENSLYDGNCGIALFLAALDYIRDSTEFRDLAMGALQSLRQLLQTSNADYAQKFVRSIGIGGATGLGSIIYSLVRMSQFLQEAVFLEVARRAATQITPELIAEERNFDVVAGTAGAILGLLALYAETGELAVLERAETCGQHLLAHQTGGNGSPKAWKNFAKKPSTGFSHGAAGIAYTLLRLYAVTGNSAYKEAAEEGIAYERSVFSTTSANWPVFSSLDRPEGQLKFMVSWCHGAAGIGLARLGSLKILETDLVRQDIEVALQTTQKYSLQDLDHLCCGNFGRIEVLLVAAKILRQNKLLETARQQAARVVKTAENNGAYQLFPDLSHSVFSPSFFRGTAGIGYELLRLAYPDILPSVLLFA